MRAVIQQPDETVLAILKADKPYRARELAKLFRDHARAQQNGYGYHGLYISADDASATAVLLDDLASTSE